MTDLSHIAESLHPMATHIGKLKPDPKNARKHSERNIAAVMASLRRFGQQKPIVALKSGTVIAGNGTLEAAQRLEKEDPRWGQIAVSIFAKRQDAMAFAIADNKTAELAEWDYEILAEQLGDMDEEMRQMTGFADYEIEPLLQAEWLPPPIKDLPNRSESKTISLDDSQWTIFNKAVEKASGKEPLTRGDALVVICQAFIGGS